MPSIRIDMLEGRSEEQKRKIVEGICKVMMEEANAKKDTITIIFNELSTDNLGKGDKLFKDL